MAIEQKDIGLSIGTSGTFKNTELGEDGKVRLKVLGTTDKGEKHYEPEGEWISDIINIGDKFREFGKLFTDHTPAGTSSMEMYSRTSNDGRTFDEWKTVLEDGTIQSEKRTHIQVKLVFKAGKVADNKSLGNALSENEYIETSGSLKLKRNYQRDLAMDDRWSGEGSLHRIKVTRDEWTRIDSLNVTSK